MVHTERVRARIQRMFNFSHTFANIFLSKTHYSILGSITCINLEQRKSSVWILLSCKFNPEVFWAFSSNKIHLLEEVPLTSEISSIAGDQNIFHLRNTYFLGWSYFTNNACNFSVNISQLQTFPLGKQILDFEDFSYHWLKTSAGYKVITGKKQS